VFKPFTNDHDISFRCDHMRAVARVTPATRQAAVGRPRRLAQVWLDSHFPLQKWNVRQARRGFGGSEVVYTYKNLVE